MGRGCLRITKVTNQIYAGGVRMENYEYMAHSYGPVAESLAIYYFLSHINADPYCEVRMNGIVFEFDRLVLFSSN